jgi:hypothetical protein
LEAAALAARTGLLDRAGTLSRAATPDPETGPEA